MAHSTGPALASAPGADVEVTGLPSRADAVRLLFLDTCRKPSTREAYARDLRRWFAWCDRAAVDPLAARRRDVQAWVTELELTEVAGHTRALSSVLRAVSVLRQFYAYAVDTGVLDGNPVPRGVGHRSP